MEDNFSPIADEVFLTFEDLSNYFRKEDMRLSYAEIFDLAIKLIIDPFDKVFVPDIEIETKIEKPFKEELKQEDSKKKEVKEIKAEPVSQVLDSTGAGDLYAAGFLYGLSQNKELNDCGHMASVAAAEVISHYGARPLGKLSNLV